MASFYDVVCLTCGEVMSWCKYDPPFERCTFCGTKLTRRGYWNQEKVKVFGVWSTSKDVRETSERCRAAFFEERGCYRFRLPDRRLCTVEMKGGSTFHIHIKAGGRKVLLVCRENEVSEVVSTLKEWGKVCLNRLLGILYRGRFYTPTDPAFKVVVEAVEANERSELQALISSP